MRPPANRHDFTTLGDIETALEAKTRRGRIYAWISFASVIAALYPMRKVNECAAVVREAPHAADALDAFIEGSLYGLAGMVLLFVIPFYLCMFIPTKIERSLHRILKNEKGA